MIKIIFLDIDGVLCLPENWRWSKGKIKFDNRHKWDENCVKNLQDLCDEILLDGDEVKIIISSQWRHFWLKQKYPLWSCRKSFYERGFKSIELIEGFIPYCEDFSEWTRSLEIKMWLEDWYITQRKEFNIEDSEEIFPVYGEHYTFCIIDDTYGFHSTQTDKVVMTSEDVGLNLERKNCALKILRNTNLGFNLFTEKDWMKKNN